MKRGHIPERTCAACGNKRRKSELMRFSVDRKEKKFRFDNGSFTGGRGMYVCPRETCLDLLEKRSARKKVPNLKGFKGEDVTLEIEKAKRFVIRESKGGLQDFQGGS